MAINANEVQNLSNLLLSNIRFKLDYKKYIDKERKLLIVEGSTDRTFVDRLKTETVDCVDATKTFKSNTMLHTKSVKDINCKLAIYKLIIGISNYPSPFCQYPEDIDKWDIYGLIDRDCDDIDLSRPVPRLMITDTHDLETLMMSTDRSIFSRIQKVSISQDDIDKAYKLSYQLAKSREILRDYYDSISFDLQKISTGSVNVDFSEFIENALVNIRKLVKYITKRSTKPLLSKGLEKKAATICNSNKAKKIFDQKGNYKSKVVDFNKNRPSDFWEIVNGHDILQILKFINQDINYAFHTNETNKLNRAFEMDLIKVYDYSSFKTTELSKEMKQNGLIPI